jgi:hypothetical protein
MMLAVALLTEDSVRTEDPGGGGSSDVVVSVVKSVLAVLGVPPGVAAYTGYVGGVDRPVLGCDVIRSSGSTSPLLLLQRLRPLMLFAMDSVFVYVLVSITSNIVNGSMKRRKIYDGKRLPQRGKKIENMGVFFELCCC